MRILFIFSPESAVQHVEDLVDVHEQYGLIRGPRPSEVGQRSDRGGTGYHAASAVVITAATDAKARELLEALTSHTESSPPEERVQVYQVPVERVL